MFCVKCGKELKDGARFCSACGAPVRSVSDAGVESLSADGASPSKPSEIQTARLPRAEQPGSAVSAPQANKTEQGGEPPRGKLSSPAIIGIVAALLVVVILVVVFFALQGGGGGGSATQGATVQQSAGSAQASSASAGQASSAAAVKEPTPEERVIKSLDGWWRIGRAWKQDHLLYFHDGTIDVYSNDGSFLRTTRTIAPSDVMRADGGLGSSGFGGPGFYFYGPERDGLGFYLSDESPDTLHQVKPDGSGYSGGDSYGRVEPPSWAASISGQSAGADSAASAQVKAEPAAAQDTAAAARDAAVAAGKQVFTGTIKATTDEDAWVMSIGQNPNAGRYYSNRAVTILFLDQKTAIEGADPISSDGYKTLENQDVIELPDSFASYDGQRVEMAFARDDLMMPSDVSHIRAKNGEVIGAGNAGTAASAPQAAAGDFVLSDSSQRRYSRSELEKMGNHELFLARNEIFARHGCGFSTPELRQRFGAMSWYTETRAPGTYGTEMLSDVEKANVDTMKAIEQERNSPYL